MDTSTVRLRALQGAPLADERVRAIVIAAAQALAERNNIPIIDLVATDKALTLTLGADRLAALGFLAELRRNTNAWYAPKHAGASLWGEPPDEPDF